MSQLITKIHKRSGEIVDFNQEKITTAIRKAAEAVGFKNYEDKIKDYSDQAVALIDEKFHHNSIPAVEEIQDVVEEVLIRNKEIKIAKDYILYRDQRARIREMDLLINSNQIMENYINKTNWEIKENSNMTYSLQGLNNHLASIISSNYWLSKVYPARIRDAYKNGDLHIHDLQLLAPYCCGWDLKDLIVQGFRGVSTKVESKPAKHFRSILGQIINFFYTLQGEVAGAEAFSNFDTYLAPFIRYDNLEYKDVKQALQEFLFNINVPTRVGFQCMSADTEILGRDGWKKYNEVKKGDTIATFNVDKGFIEYLPVNHVFARKYKGKMYNLKNRISDQLISPEHRVVRKKFNSDGYVLETIEKVKELKSPFIVPVGSLGNFGPATSLSDDEVRLLAWVIAEGTLDKGERGSGRVSIYQSKSANLSDYEEIKAICDNLNLKYAERAQKGLGADCQVLRFDASSTRKILKYFGGDKKLGIKFIPKNILGADVETARLFLETYVKGDGHEGCKITTASAVIRDGLMQVAVNAGYGVTVLEVKPRGISKKIRYIIRLIEHVDTYINAVKEVNYEGVIWCPNTKNETVIARRHGKIFITGNTPFTNITLDLKVSPAIGEENVIIGGEIKPEKYKDFQKEMDMINIAFAELMMEGDAKGRVFTFPIPTYNITKDFEWESPVAEKIFEMTAKYGIPYFSNFINSDMSPDDARSMCCRLRLDNRELKKRGGGLFGSNPLTGSVGVVTINLPRIGYLAKDKEDFFKRLEELMLIAKESLEIKRDVLEKLTDNGLYPYARHYLGAIKERFGGYWNNHFSTIGILGMNEALLNFKPVREAIASPRGKKFAEEILDFMREKIMDFQNQTNHLFNLEATPGEGTTRRFSRADKDRFPDIIVANEEAIQEGAMSPYYTNSSQLPVNYTDDLFEALDIQDDLQTKYTGGTVFHAFIGEALPNPESVRELVYKISNKYHLPYFTLTPTFSVCPIHGYLAGAHKYCPKCDEERGITVEMEERPAMKASENA
jgi:ribonucleoside-triphosphate reductase